MKFSMFRSARAQKGEECTYERYLDVANSEWLLRLCNEIAAEKDEDKRGEMKKRLPVITWQAYFPGKRLNKEAMPSGLFMLDIDHVENPGKVFNEKVASHLKELGIVFVGMTASRHGLRIVAKCLPTLHSLEECQKWLATSLGVEYDGVCKDWARCSFLVHDSYCYYMDADAIWGKEAVDGVLYAVGPAEQLVLQQPAEEPQDTPPLEPSEGVDQREGLFGGSDDYKGVPYSQIAKEWLLATGGEPERGERNARLYKLALRLRYITDFNEATLLRVMPRYGLDESEIKGLIHSACTSTRASQMPRDLEDVLQNIDRRAKIADGDEELPEVITDTTKLPPLPPVIREYTNAAPDDFKAAVVMCQLPILGTLGSRLRARYLDGRIHEPSFQVSLEAPQASGKSFMTRLAEAELAQVIEHDEMERLREQEYDAKVREMKLLNIKINADNKDEILGQRPNSMVRYCSPKISITKLLMRISQAKGLHIFAMAPEIDTVYKAFKSGFSSYSDLLRVAFDNETYGQDYASENSFSGLVTVRYNVLFSGTPKAMRRFYPDVEDGLVSRVCFVTLPDQFGKPMPVWRELTTEEKAVVDLGLVRLNEITIQGDEVQPEHEMKLAFLNTALDKWIKSQQVEAVKEDDRTRDIFCRRAAVVGFRAGMLCYYLWGEKNTPTIRRNTTAFAVWVANMMLNQHLLRFNVQTTNSNTNHWEEAYKMVGDEFTRDELAKALQATNSDTPVKMVLYKWRLLGVIETTQVERRQQGMKTQVKFKKIRK